MKDSLVTFRSAGWTGAAAAWYCSYALQAEQRLRTGERLECLALLDVEIHNLRAALVWAIDEQHDPALGVALLTALRQFWHMRGYYHEARCWLEKGILLLTEDSVLRAAAYLALGYLAWFQREYQQARAACEKSVQLYEHYADPGGQCEAYCFLAMSLLRESNDAVGASSLLQQALRLAEQADQWHQAVALFWQSVILIEQYEYGAAQQSALASWAYFQASGDRWNAGPLSILADIAEHHGDLLQAQHVYEAVTQAFQEINDRWGLAFSLRRLAEISLGLGDRQRSYDLAQQSLKLWQQLNDPYAIQRLRAILQRI